MKKFSTMVLPTLALALMVIVSGCGQQASTPAPSTSPTTLTGQVTGSPPFAANVECYAYNSSGSKVDLGSTTADSDGRYSLTVNLSDDVKNVIIKAVAADGSKTRLAVQPVVEKGKTTYCKPTSGQDTIKARIFEKMKEQGIDLTKFDVSKIDASLTQVSTTVINPDNASDPNIAKVAESVKAGQTAEDSFRVKLGISEAVWAALRDYGYARYRVHSEAIFTAARNEKRAVTPAEFKEIEQKVEKDVFAKAVELGVSPTTLSLMKKQVEKRFEAKLEENLGANSEVTRQCKAYNGLNNIIRILEAKLNAIEELVKYADPDNAAALTTLATTRTNLIAALKEKAAQATPPNEMELGAIFQQFGSSVETLFGVSGVGQVSSGSLMAKLLVKAGKTQQDLVSFMTAVSTTVDANLTQDQVADRIKAINDNMTAKIDLFFAGLPAAVREAMKTLALSGSGV